MVCILIIFIYFVCIQIKGDNPYLSHKPVCSSLLTFLRLLGFITQEYRFLQRELNFVIFLETFETFTYFNCLLSHMCLKPQNSIK